MANNFYIQSGGGCQIIIVQSATGDNSSLAHRALRTCAAFITVVAGLLKIALALSAFF
jgi:hypothetical protein